MSKVSACLLAASAALIITACSGEPAPKDKAADAAAAAAGRIVRLNASLDQVVAPETPDREGEHGENSSKGRCGARAACGSRTWSATACMR